MLTELSIIVPVLNERENIPVLLARLEQTLGDIDWEVVFVDDDSGDGSLEILKDLARRNPRVRFIQRVHRRGLSSACLEGMGASASKYLAVMDGDLQHDEALLPQMLAALKSGDCDIAVGSRYIEGGSVGSWDRRRAGLSRLATRFVRLLMHTDMTDPMSGFFMIRREVFERTVHDVSGKGFKILLDIVTAGRGRLRIKELPFTFRTRERGTSKLDTLVAWEFLLLVTERLLGRYVPVRFIMFITVGALGAVLHIAVLGAGLYVFDAPFMVSQGVAAFLAMIANFLLNNLFTYRDLRLGGARLFLGLVGFIAICSIGAVVNIEIATKVFRAGLPWWLAGLTGAAIGAVWNFAVSSTLVWERRRRPTQS